MITEGDNTPYLVVVNTRRQNTVQDSLLNLSVVQHLQRVEVPRISANNKTADY